MSNVQVGDDVRVTSALDGRVSRVRNGTMTVRTVDGVTHEDLPAYDMTTGAQSIRVEILGGEPKALKHEDAQALRRQALKMALEAATVSAFKSRVFSTAEDIAKDARTFYAFLSGDAA
jgi:hypothetical protein